MEVLVRVKEIPRLLLGSSLAGTAPDYSAAHRCSPGRARLNTSVGIIIKTRYNTYMNKYNPLMIEPKWQKLWAENHFYEAHDDSDKEKYYVLVEFPYPSGDGLHTGHVRSYTAQDIIARRLRMMGKNVLYPMGWDAFGLPTENYAIKHKIRPQDATAKNVATFKRQMQALGFSFDWSREINTTDPKYYRWTQWIFLQLLKHNLAYQAKIAINWCPKCKTGLANEEVVNGKHERCGTVVEKKLLNQWLLKITEYADRLAEDLKTVDYPEHIASQQINWIGKSTGARIQFGIDGHNDRLEVFTTRPDTIFGATFMVLAPEHPMVEKITTDVQKQEVKDYVKRAASISNIERMEQKEKTGVFTGAYAVNPANNENIPIWIADYVLMDYGTGAIMAVPAHDERDYEFAIKHGISILQVIEQLDSKDNKLPLLNDGKLINSKEFDGLNTEEAKESITKWLNSKGVANEEVQYKLRDWIFSRQHYWGEPIPVIHCIKCGVVPVPEEDLPVELPDVDAYEPTDTGESPLAAISDWVNVDCPKCGGSAKRETDTMPNWAGSSWYYLRYIDPHNNEAFAAPDKLNTWLMVDLYNGGMEHTTLHLLYSRFWHKFLYDQKLVPTLEPYAARRSHGMILGPDGNKMSKSLGNVVNPDDSIAKYGADALRMYEMFMGPYDQQIAWSDEKLAGMSRFLNKIWNLTTQLSSQDKADIEPSAEDEVFEVEVDSMIHKTLKKVDNDIEKRQFNTVVSALMELVNFLNEPSRMIKLMSTNFEPLADRAQKYLALMLAPLAPHIAEEIWQNCGGIESVHLQAWPKYDPNLVKKDVVTIVVQVNGKLKGEFVVDTGTAKEDIEHQALALNSTKQWTKDQEIIKTVIVPNRLVNFVTK